MNILIPTQFYYPRKNTSNINIITPFTIYMTWSYSELPTDMYENIITNIKNNPEFDFYIYDDNKCREFIQDNFDTDVLNAFDNLVPGAYKADLWRYCILYKNGGIYMDIKYSIKTKLIDLVKKYPLCFVKDRLTNRVYNGVMIVPPNFKIFDYAIKEIVNNVKNKYYGRDPLDPTGPGLLGKIISDNDYNSTVQLLFIGGDKIVDTNYMIIFKKYPTYRKEQQKNQKTDTYPNLWLNNKIYL
jgi:mannosyltransferase OCH1-like enzyme